MKDLQQIREELPKYKNGSKAIPKDEIVVPLSAIISLLQEDRVQSRKAVVEMCKNMKKIRKPKFRYECEQCGHGSERAECFCGYNQALDDIITNLEQNNI